MCDSCHEEITKEQKNSALKFGSKWFHFDCPRKARDRAWENVLKDLGQEYL